MKRMDRGRTPGPNRPGDRRESGRTAWIRDRLLPAALILALAIAAHSPAIGAGFVWDDDVNVTANTHLHDASGLYNLWFRMGSTNLYAPLTFTTLWVEHQLWGENPLGYHVVNIALHATCALLLWAFLRKLMAGGAWLAAAIFAAHPVAVESVAWVTELRNMQSAVLYLLCLLAYFRFIGSTATAGHAQDRRWLFYALSLLLFAAALLSKPSAVGLPVVMLLLAWWKRGSIGRIDVMTVAPMFAMSILVGLVTMYGDRTYAGGVGEAWQMSVAERFLTSGRALWFYVGTLLWPYPLSSVYPRWDVDASRWWQYLFPLAAGAALLALWVGRKKVGRGPLVAALSFAIIAAPTTGVFNFSYHLYAFVADHYVYHAAPALIALFAAGVIAFRRTLRRRGQTWSVDVACGTMVLVLGVLSVEHAQAFRSEKARCLDTLEKNPGAWVAMNNLAVALNAEGRHAEAVEWYQRALGVRPVYPEAHSNLGVALMAMGRVPEAIEHYREALRVWPDYAFARNNLGTALASLGNVNEAMRQYREALRIRPDYAEAHNNLATLLASTGDVREAITEHEAALRIRPDYARAHHDLGVTLASAGRHREAIEAYRSALRLEPGNAGTHSDLGTALEADGRHEEAMLAYREAIRISPGYAGAHNGMGLALVSAGRLREAVQQFEEALRIDSTDAGIHNNLGTTLALGGDVQGAILQYREALRIRPEYAQALANLGKALFSQGDPAAAVRPLEDAVRLGADTAEAHNLLGACLAEAGRLDEAIAHFERALALNVNDRSARENLARAKALRRTPRSGR
jgi:protein O-mannosyl-transferase